MGGLVIRADAGPAIGGGHIMRCLAIAAAFRELHGTDAPVTFVRSAAKRDAFEARIESSGFSVRHLPPGLDASSDADATATIAQSAHATWVVVDGYGFDGAYEHRLSLHGLRVAALDDYVHTRHEAYLIVSPGLGARTDSYLPVRPGVRVLAGPEYALIRPEFLRHRGVPREPRTSLSRVLVTLGASDPHHLVPRLVDALAPLPGLDVRVVLGGADLHAAESELLCRRAGFTVLHDVPDMAEPMLWADLAISGGGGTLLELLLLGTPSLTVVVAENQRAGAEAAASRGLMHLLGDARELTAEGVRTEVAALIAAPARAAEMARAGREIDGLGAHRVCLALDAASNSLPAS